MSQTHSKALQYHVNGYSVIPIDPKSKRPLIKWTEFQKNHADESQLEKWFDKKTPPNVGVVTGKISGITVVDIDVKESESTPLKTFPPTYTVKTPSGGYHLYYEYNDKVQTGSNQYPQFPHVDIRNDGGYVVAPPSKTPKGAYKVLRAKAIAPFPVELFKKKKSNSLRHSVDLTSGDRNQSITSVIGQLLYSLPESKWNKDAWPVIVSINKTYKPPLSEKELKTTFESIAKKEKDRRINSVPSPFKIDEEDQVKIKLRKNGANIPYKDMLNVLLVLQQHPKLKDVIRYNSFGHVVEFKGEPLGENYLTEIQGIIQDRILPGVSKQVVDDAINQYAHMHEYDEVLIWAKSLKWDGKKRLANWLTKACHVEDSKYHQAVGAQWLLGLMKRILYPGCVFDHVLVFIGPQGVGKTSVFRILGGDWYKSYSGGLDTKDFYLTLAGAMIVDLDEGVTMYKSESIKMKSMITQTVDEYRAPYARRPERYPRRFVFSMSTNDLEPFRDMTGNRRYWPVELNEKMVDFKWLEENREQLFAEAYHAVKNKVKYPEVDMKEAQEKQMEYLPEDEWSNKVIEYVTLSGSYRKGSADYQITIDELFEKAIGGELKFLDRRVQIRIGDILRSRLGLTRVRRMEDGVRKYFYILTEKKQEELRKKPLNTPPVDDDW